MEVNSKTVKNKNIKLGDYIQIEKIKKLKLNWYNSFLIIYNNLIFLHKIFLHIFKKFPRLVSKILKYVKII